MTTSYPTGGSFASNFSTSSKTNPCPVCGRTKDGDCRISRDGKMVLCHQNFDHTKTQQPDLWHFDKPSSDGRCGVYVFKEKTTKSIRPKQTRYWEYPDRDGSRLVRVVRVDDGEGNKKVWQEHWDKNKKAWVNGYGDVARATIPIYRRAEVQEAIAKRKPIYIAEGEPCVDLLWKLGLAATTNIGGGEKFTLTDSMDLQGAELIVIVPDRDKKGIKHAEKVAEYFPEALWLYPFPESKVWENLPDDHGLDIADWIEHNKLTAEGIKAAIGEKQVFKAPPQTGAKVVSHPRFEAPSLSDLAVKIDQLLEADLRKSQLQIQISELAQIYRLTAAEVWKIYRTREQEQEQEFSQEDTAAEVAWLLSAQKTQIELSEILPPGLAAPIEKLATKLNLKTECYLAALLTQVSSLFKVGSEVLLRRDTDYRCTPNYFLGIVGESSQKKSPIMRAMIDRPMQSLREKARQEYQKACEIYEQELAAYKSNKKKSANDEQEPPPRQPRQKLYSFSKATNEGILYQVAEHPDQALMYRCDELAGLFKSANQYRGGKGSDEEDLLEFWNGTGSTVLRASGATADLDGLLLSVFGTIQPEVLATLLKDCSDANGKFARFDFVFQPVAASKLPEEDSGGFDITPMLSALYTKIDSLPALKMELSPDAKRLFTVFYNAMEERREKEPKQGIRAMVGKMAEKVGKMAAIIHSLTCAFNGVEVSSSIPKTAVEAAIKFVKFSSDQIANLYAEFSDRTALAPSLAKIVVLAERKGGSVSVRDISLAFDSKHRPNGQQIREWLQELVNLKYGKVTSTGRKITFTISPRSTVSTLTSNQDTASLQPIHTKELAYPHLSTFNEQSVDKCGYIVDNPIHTSEPIPDKTLEPNVDTVDTQTPFVKNSNSLMMSCATEVSPEDAEKLRDIALIWWPEYYPEQLQNLLTQMYAWNAPGTKYDVAVIANWLEGQDEVIRERIIELVNQKKASLNR